MPSIIPVNYRDDILPEYRGTPVELLLEYHNLGRAMGATPAPQMLIGMCMDSRKSLRIPNDFAFVLREDSNCIDVGANRGVILAEMCRVAPGGRHIAFEPTPIKARWLRKKFPEVQVEEVAVSDVAGERSERGVPTS